MKADKILLIDTDPGIDDALALALAFRHPNVQVPLVTTVAGNTGIESVTTNAQLLLPLFGADASTVLAKGAAKPLKRNAETAEDFHGPDGLGGVRDSVAKQIAKPSAVKANGIKRIVEAAKHRLHTGLQPVQVRLFYKACLLDSESAAHKGDFPLCIVGRKKHDFYAYQII